MDKKEHPLITSLEKLRDTKDRAALAKLKRGLGKKMGTPEMFPYVVPYLPKLHWEQEQCFLVAALFALHPAESQRGVSLGKVFRRMWEKSEKSESIEKRFQNLLSVDPEDLGRHLRQAISLAKSHNVPIDYHCLMYDLRYWDHPDRFVQMAWAKDFWGYEKQEPSDQLEKGE